MGNTQTLSIIIPVYNEAATLAECIRRVGWSNPTAEIIVVDDGSTDGSLEIAQRYCERVLSLPHLGKGHALREGIHYATGEFVLIHDADLEYEAFSAPHLLYPQHWQDIDVVIGYRDLRGNVHRWGNWFVTQVSNLFTGLKLRDIECGYKLFRREVLEGLDLKENGFGIELELMHKVKDFRVKQLPVSYTPRTVAEGKKIRWHHAIEALWCIWKYR